MHTKKNIINTKAIMNGSNISFTKKTNVSFPMNLFYSESLKMIYDNYINYIN